MFAVKGWSVDAGKLKPQTETNSKRKDAGRDGRNKSNKKRKRDNDSNTPQDVGSLWEQHIEGKGPANGKKQKLSGANNIEVRERSKKQEKPDEQSTVIADVPAPFADKANVKPKKERRKRAKEAVATGTDAPAQDQVADKSAQIAKPATKAAKAAKDTPPVPALPPTAKLTPMQSAMRQKLVSARFRHLNQTLYTAPSDTALELFNQNPEMFEDYHAGFRQQVSVWPENPVDHFIATLRSRGQVKQPKNNDKRPKKGDAYTNAQGVTVLPRTQGTCVVADLGCGDARLAQTLKDGGDTSKLNFKVHSFDLHSPAPLVTKADISDIPLPDGSVNTAIFCLALMGTNWISFIEEAYRILHWKGELWVAEIKSRFGRVGKAGKPVAHSVGGKKKVAAFQKAQENKKKEETEVDEQATLRSEVDGVEVKNEETDVSAFVDVLRRRGFLLKDGDKSIDLGNKMFVKMEFIKAAPPIKGKGAVEAPVQSSLKKKFIDEGKDDIATEDEAKVLKPCLYKIR